MKEPDEEQFLKFVIYHLMNKLKRKQFILDLTKIYKNKDFKISNKEGKVYLEVGNFKNDRP